MVALGLAAGWLFSKHIFEQWLVIPHCILKTMVDLKLWGPTADQKKLMTVQVASERWSTGEFEIWKGKISPSANPITGLAFFLLLACLWDPNAMAERPRVSIASQLRLSAVFPAAGSPGFFYCLLAYGHPNATAERPRVSIASQLRLSAVFPAAGSPMDLKTAEPCSQLRALAVFQRLARPWT